MVKNSHALTRNNTYFIFLIKQGTLDLISIIFTYVNQPFISVEHFEEIGKIERCFLQKVYTL